MANEKVDILLALRAEFDQFRKAQAASDSLRNSIGRIAKMAAVFSGVQIGVQGLVDTLKRGATAGIRFNATIEAQEVAFKTLLGSTEAAQQRIAELVEFSAKTPFRLTEVVQASRMLQALTDGALASGDALRLVGDTAAATGQPINEVSMWIGRLYSGLKNGLPIGEATARLVEMGVLGGETKMELESLTKTAQGQTKAMEILENTFGKFGGSMEDLSGTFNGLLSTFQDLMDAFQGEAMGPTFDLLKQKLEGLVEQMKEADGEQFADTIRDIVQAMLDMVSAIGKVIKVGKGAVDAIGGIEVALGFVLAGLAVKKTYALATAWGAVAKNAGAAAGAIGAAGAANAAATAGGAAGGFMPMGRLGRLGRLGGMGSILRGGNLLKLLGGVLRGATGPAGIVTTLVGGTAISALERRAIERQNATSAKQENASARIAEMTAMAKEATSLLQVERIREKVANEIRILQADTSGKMEVQLRSAESLLAVLDRSGEQIVARNKALLDTERTNDRILQKEKEREAANARILAQDKEIAAQLEQMTLAQLSAEEKLARLQAERRARIGDDSTTEEFLSRGADIAGDDPVSLARLRAHELFLRQSDEKIAALEKEIQAKKIQAAIEEKEMEALRARADGHDAIADAIEAQITLAQQTVALADEKNIPLATARDLILEQRDLQDQINERLRAGKVLAQERATLAEMETTKAALLATQAAARQAGDEATVLSLQERIDALAEEAAQQQMIVDLAEKYNATSEEGLQIIKERVAAIEAEKQAIAQRSAALRSNADQWSSSAQSNGTDIHDLVRAANKQAGDGISFRVVNKGNGEKVAQRMVNGSPDREFSARHLAGFTDMPSGDSGSKKSGGAAIALGGLAGAVNSGTISAVKLAEMLGQNETEQQKWERRRKAGGYNPVMEARAAAAAERAESEFAKNQKLNADAMTSFADSIARQNKDIERLKAHFTRRLS